MTNGRTTGAMSLLFNPRGLWQFRFRVGALDEGYANGKYPANNRDDN
jgi:hypothetical protein